MKTIVQTKTCPADASEIHSPQSGL
jgi:hypothetical protein